MARKPGAAERAAELLDLPVDSLAGVPRLTLVGSRSAVVEQHRGLLLYSPEQIEIEGGRVRLRIRGDGLRLQAMDREALLVRGEIVSVEFF